MDPHNSDDDATSDYGGSVGTSEFTSVNTARLLYSYEHGRRYQGFLHSRYGLPNDDAEQVREGVKHKMYVDYILDGKLFIAPIGSNPQKIVDLGTGTGLWAQDVAEYYPSARIIGTDISAIQPNWSAPNVEFRVEDLEEETRPWTNIYADADLIHIRAMLQTLRRPRSLIEKAFQNLKPGGWIESHELLPAAFSDDDTVDAEYPLNKIFHLIDRCFARIYGWNIDFPGRLTGVLQEVGFVNISERHNAIPIGRWHQDSKKREMGMFNQSVVSDFIGAMLAKNEAMGMNEEEAHELGQSTLDAFNNPRIHAQLDWYDCWAQKPLE